MMTGHLAISVVVGLLLLGAIGSGGQAQELQHDTPWWEEQKIIFMWGQWGHAGQDKSLSVTQREVPREVFEAIKQAGATVFAEHWDVIPAHQRYAQEVGLRYFASLYVYELANLESGAVRSVNRRAVTQTGELSDPRRPHCPLEQAVYEQWIVEPLLEGVRVGLIDGLHFDWEAYGGYGEAPMPCYCEDCFSKFLAAQGLEEVVPEPAERYPWLEAQGLTQAYAEVFSARRFQMFTTIRETLQAERPDLLFSAYEAIVSDFTRAMNTPQTPMIFLDARHYYNDDRQPWWESYALRLQQEGYLYIPGAWTTALFGAQASQVSAARWIYEAAMDTDGCWLWFERELDDDILRAYAAATREIRTAESRVGEFLFQGRRDPGFVTAVEWSGRPELEKALLTRTYHLGDEHLVHVFNVNTEWPLRARLRFPRLPAATRYTVRDPLRGLYYTPEGESAQWSAERLREGVVVAMEPRSDLFLQVTPVERTPQVEAAALLASADFSRLPEHARAAAAATGPEAEDSAAVELLYTVTEPMGFEGAEGALTIGSAIHGVNAGGGNPTRLRQLRGHLWSPVYSPDGSQVAFVHDAGGRGQICVMDADGANAVNLSSNAHCDRSPVWSPDGNRLAFVSDRNGDWDIYVMDADGSGQQRLAGNPGLDRAPAWSPDGTRIAWESHVSGIPNLWIVDADGTNSRPVLDRDLDQPLTQATNYYLTDPLWSPDGQRIAAWHLGGYSGHIFLATHQVVVLEADGSRMIEAARWLGGVEDICWSPDGTRLAVAARCGPHETERAGVVVVRADGSDRVAYADLEFLVEATPQGPRIGEARRYGTLSWYTHGSAQPRRVVKTFTSLAWSPDGTTLAFTSDLDPSGAFYVYTIPAEGGEPIRLDATRSAWPHQIGWRPQSGE